MNQSIFISSLKNCTDLKNVTSLASWIYYHILSRNANEVRSFIDLDIIAIKIVIENADNKLLQSYLDMYVSESIHFDAEIINLFIKKDVQYNFKLVILRSIAEDNTEIFKLLSKDNLSTFELYDIFEMACRKGSIEIVKLLLPTICPKIKYLCCSLLDAIDSGNCEVIQFLINEGFTISFSCLEAAIFSERTDIVELLFQKLNVDEGDSLIHIIKFIVDNDLYEMTNVLMKNIGHYINTYNCVDYCACNDKLEFVKLFIEGGAETTDKSLIYAATNRNHDMLTYLKQRK